MRRKLKPRIVRAESAHLRLATAIVLGVVTGFLPFGNLSDVAHALIGWNVAVAFYLVAVGIMAALASISDIRKRACEQDEGALALLILIVVAAIASLGAIFFELAAASNSRISYVIAIATVVLSWIFVQVIFALHYAHEFYGEGERANGLDFPGDAEPDYWDFIYFSFVIGMTFQVSDVAVTNKWIRRLVVAHGFVAFLFNTTVIALAVNIAGKFF